MQFTVFGTFRETMATSPSPFPGGNMIGSFLERHNFDELGPDEASVFDLPEAPVFYPTPEEFENPWRFLNSIRHIIRQTGICVIQPPHSDGPQGWDFESFEKHIDPKNFVIATKQQNVHQMQSREGPSVNYARQLVRFWAEHGQPIEVLPEVQGIVVDFKKLNESVEAHGGFDEVLT